MMWFVIGLLVGFAAGAAVMRALDLAGTEAVLRGQFGW